MLTVNIYNVGGGTDNSASYEYEVFVNRQLISKGFIKGHNRDDGWAELLGLIAEHGKTKPKTELESILRGNFRA